MRNGFKRHNVINQKIHTKTGTSFLHMPTQEWADLFIRQVLGMRLSASEMDMVRKPERRRTFPPYVKHWTAGGVVIGIIMTTVLLILEASKQQDTDTTIQDVMPQPREELEAQEDRGLSSDIPLDTSSDVEETLAAPKARFEFYDLLPKMEVVIQEDDPPASIKQVPTTPSPVTPASYAPAETYYLQAGSFRGKERADILRTKLSGLGFECEIQESSIHKSDVYHRVLVGPFTDLKVLDKSRQELDEFGIETRKIKSK